MMLSLQEARERLRAFYDSDHKKNQVRRLSALPGKISTMGQILIRAGVEWIKVANQREKMVKAQSETVIRLGKLNSKERTRLFQALFPGIASEVVATWNSFDRLPYQFWYFRRPFRNPTHYSPQARVAWLHQLIHATEGYEDQDVSWLAVWASHLGYATPDALGYLFAGAIDRGGRVGEEVYQTLVASANGTHEIGSMGRHVARGLLCSSRAEGWDFMARMLLAAQREEGLRQVILECLDEAHPQAFRRMLRLILDRNLARFSAAIRAFDVWFGLAFDPARPKVANETLSRVLLYLESPADRNKALKGDAPQEAYYALWATAFEDVSAALPYAIALHNSKQVEKRFVAIHFLSQVHLPESHQELLKALEDEDLRIAAHAANGLAYAHFTGEKIEKSNLFEQLENLIKRLPHKENTFKPLVWEWIPLTLNREDLANRLATCLGSRSPKRLIPYLPMMAPFERGRVADLIGELGKKDAEAREVLLELAGDPSSQTREQALKALTGFALKESEAIQLEALLSRKPEDLRRGLIHLLLSQSDGAVIQSIQRLLRAKSDGQRTAGLELLRQCKQASRRVEDCLRLAAEYKTQVPKDDNETQVLGDVLAEQRVVYSLNDALGLMKPHNRTIPKSVDHSSRKARKIELVSRAGLECLESLDELVGEHGTDAVEIVVGATKKSELLGNIRWGFPHPDPRQTAEQDLARLPLSEVWETWWGSRADRLKDADGLELIRALAAIRLFGSRWTGLLRPAAEVPRDLQKHFGFRTDIKLNYESVVQLVIEWLVRVHPVPGEVEFILDSLEETVSRIPINELSGVNESYGRRARTLSRQHLIFLELARWQRSFRPETWTDGHHARLWKIDRWLDEPKPGLPRFHPVLEDALLAFQAGAATRDDLLDLFMGPRDPLGYGGRFEHLQQFSGRRPHPAFAQYPILKELVDECRERILSIETKRGDLPTEATSPARFICSVPGLDNLMRLLVALGKTNFERGYAFGQSRAAVLSHLIRNSYPLETDTIEVFAREAGLHHLSERRLVQLAVYAPQWATFVESALGWPNLAEAVWWVYAHTKDRQWTVDKDIREEWAARITEFTPLSPSSLMDGAVDVTWFHKVYSALGPDRWGEVYRAAEYAAGGAGHTRARLFADAMFGSLSDQATVQRLTTKRHQDSVRALGLLPLPAGPERQKTILRRYEAMQEFLRTSKKFGSMRRASEKLAVSIGMENLARTAGYPDPQRLEWAMELEAVSDLAEGPVTVVKDGIRLSLSIDELGEPNLTITKKGKELKALPSAIKKDEDVASLLDRKQQLDRQVKRMRLSLEEAMCRGDSFSGAELKGLSRHPMLRVMIEQLVFISPSGMGYPIKNAKAVQHHSGKQIPISAKDALRIAHPEDLLASGEWSEWQHECFVTERIQPFKQIFRELYVLTAAEKGEGNLSRRYAGQQVNPRQALALFGTCGWVTDPEEGVRKTFHQAGFSAHIGFLQGTFTPAEVEGLTLEAVAFTKRGSWEIIPLEQIPTRVFSEVMCDLDLVVSVAHAGGVDPEASASSIESRAALIRETCGLLQLSNIRLTNTHVIVEGKLSSYNVHLGSGVVHKQPGGAMCIIPVHSQHRGRLFLPFVEDDPKTAEIVSKVILLARDDQIKDPTILEQIMG